MNEGEHQPRRQDGSPLTEREVRRGMRLNIIAGSMGVVYVATVLGIPLVMMLESLGASGVQIGLATTIQQLAMLVQIPASLLAERFTGRKRFWAVTSLIHRLLWFVPAFLLLTLPRQPVLVTHLVLVVLAISSVLAQAATPCWYSWMADLVPPHASARFWSRRQSVVMVSYLLATTAFGYLLDFFPDPRAGGSMNGFVIVFVLGAFFGGADIIIHTGVPEPQAAPSPPGTHLGARLLAALRIADFRWLTLCMGAWSFAVGLFSSFGVIYLRREFGLSYLQLSATSVAASIGAILAGFQSGYVIDRLGARAYAAVLLLIGPLSGLTWFFLNKTSFSLALPWFGHFDVPQPVVLLSLVNLAAGALFSSLGLCQLRLLTALAPSAGRTTAMAVHWTLIGAMAALGPLLGGAVVDWLEIHPVGWVLPSGMPFSFMHALVPLFMLFTWFVCVPLILKVSLRKGDLPVGVALPRLWLGNPLRAVRNVYNIYAITAAVSAHDRAEAVRGLGDSRAALAVSDLIANLDNPDYEVREEAAAALGKVGTPDAIDALLARLEIADTDLGPQLARALRQARTPRAVDLLVRKLADEDRELRCEAARALGVIRDKRATQPLVDLLGRTHDAKLLVACTEALGRLGELAVLPRLLDELRTTHSRTVKRSVELTIADLLGRRGEFYKLLTREEKARGGEVERLLAELRDRLPPTQAAAETLLRSVETAYEKAEITNAAESLRQLANKLAAGSAEPVWLNVIAYLEALRTPWGMTDQDQRHQTDVLLGIYLVCTAADRK